MNEETGTRPVPPYVSWTTVNNKLDEMGQKGIPARIDASYLVGMAGGTQNQFKQALRSLGLIDAGDNVTPALIDLVNDPDGRPRRIGELLQQRYPALTALNGNATQGQLDEVLAEYGLGSKDTRRKAASFYVAAASYAGLPLSPHLKPRGSGGTGTTRTTRRRTVQRKDPAAAGTSDTTPPGAVSHSIDLASGGTVTVAVSMNIFELSKADRTFVLDLVDMLQGYEAPDSPVMPSPGDADSQPKGGES